MKWSTVDVEMFEKSKDYVDTMVVPLVPISFGMDMKETAIMNDFISLLTSLIERQFKGRMVLLPSHSYRKIESVEEQYINLLKWESYIKENGFKHIFYITSDSEWKVVENKLTGTIIWVPALPLEQMDENSRQAIMETQVKQLMNLFLQKWN